MFKQDHIQALCDGAPEAQLLPLTRTNEEDVMIFLPVRLLLRMFT